MTLREYLGNPLVIGGLFGVAVGLTCFLGEFEPYSSIRKPDRVERRDELAYLLDHTEIRISSSQTPQDSSEKLKNLLALVEEYHALQKDPSVIAESQSYSAAVEQEDKERERDTLPYTGVTAAALLVIAAGAIRPSKKSTKPSNNL